jgi:hypothetical protein
MAIYSVTPSTTVLDEGQSISFVITTEEVASGTILYYTLSGDVSENDFTDNTLSGSVTVIDFGSGTATGTVTKVISLDLVTEGDEEFVFELRTDSTSGSIVATSSTVTIKDVNPTFSITQTATTIEEGQSVTFNIATTKIANGTELFFTTIGNVTESDFSDNSLSDSFVIINFGGDNGIGAFTRTTTSDFISSENKQFQVQLRVNSTEGAVVGTSNTVTINSKQPTYAITPSTTLINEGESVTFTISTNVPDDSVLYYTTLGNISASDFDDGLLSGTITISDGSATLVKETIQDRKTEGDEDFAIQLRVGSTGGTIVATSAFVKIKDTSRNVSENANNLTFGPIQVNIDNGNPIFVTDWYNICQIDDLPEGSKIALYVNDIAKVQASYDLFLSKLIEKNISVISVTDEDDDWITPFLTDLN